MKGVWAVKREKSIACKWSSSSEQSAYWILRITVCFLPCDLLRAAYFLYPLLNHYRRIACSSESPSGFTRSRTGRSWLLPASLFFLINAAWYPLIQESLENLVMPVRVTKSVMTYWISAQRSKTIFLKILAAHQARCQNETSYGRVLYEPFSPRVFPLSWESEPLEKWHAGLTVSSLLKLPGRASSPLNHSHHNKISLPQRNVTRFLLLKSHQSLPQPVIIC